MGPAAADQGRICRHPVKSYQRNEPGAANLTHNPFRTLPIMHGSFAGWISSFLSLARGVCGFLVSSVYQLWRGCRQTFPTWFIAVSVCVALSLISFLIFDFDLLIAPVIKLFLLAKAALLSAWLAGIHLGKALIKTIGVLAIAIFGSWEAWSAKKLVRQGLRASASITTRFLAFNLLINLFAGKERKGIRNLPQWALFKLSSTWIGRIFTWWNRASDRTKRITTGAVLCLILVLAGQAFIGMSILIFDLVWELLIILFRQLVSLWRLIGPIILKLIPNVISTFVTERLLPLFSEAVPLVRDDHRIIYARFDLRERYRRLKQKLLMYSRTIRHPLRNRVRGYLPGSLRQLKDRLLHAAAGFTVSTDKHESTDNSTDTPDKQ